MGCRTGCSNPHRENHNQIEQGMWSILYMHAGVGVGAPMGVAPVVA